MYDVGDRLLDVGLGVGLGQEKKERIFLVFFLLFAAWECTVVEYATRLNALHPEAHVVESSLIYSTRLSLPSWLLPPFYSIPTSCIFGAIFTIYETVTEPPQNEAYTTF